MIIPKTELKKWSNLREQGDLTNMESESEEIVGEKVSRQRLARAIERGRCSEVAYKLLKSYYSKKESAAA